LIEQNAESDRFGVLKRWFQLFVEITEIYTDVVERNEAVCIEYFFDNLLALKRRACF